MYCVLFWLSLRRLDDIQLAKINKQQLARMFPGVDFLESVVDLGVVIDQELRMDRHIGKLSQSCFYQLRQLRTVYTSIS